jgi:hypothetical protein
VLSIQKHISEYGGCWQGQTCPTLKVKIRNTLQSNARSGAFSAGGWTAVLEHDVNYLKLAIAAASLS